MEEINKLEKKVEKLEYNRIAKIENDVQNMKLELTKNNLLTEQNTQAMCKMSETMDNVRETMIKLSDSVERSNQVNEKLAQNVKSIEAKVDNLEEKVEKVDEKSKFDITLFLKDNWIPIVMTSGILVYLFIK